MWICKRCGTTNAAWEMRCGGCEAERGATGNPTQLQVSSELRQESGVVPEILEETGKSMKILSIVFLIGALVFAAAGLRTIYSYGSDDKVVGGDAYNFIILAGRGTGLICVGIVSGLISTVFAIFDLSSASNNSKS